MHWVLAIAIVVAAAVALVAVTRLRKARLQQRFRLEIANEGNVPCRYDLRAEDAGGVLRFQFLMDGDDLPAYGSVAASGPADRQESGRPAPARAAAQTQGVRQKAGRAMQAGGVVAGLLSMLGSLLPRSIGIPLQQKASEMRRVQARASYVQQVPNQMAWLKSSAQRAVPGLPSRKESAAEQPPEPAVPGDGLVWSQTPTVEPGGTLAVELLVRSAVAARNQRHAYRVVSRAAERTMEEPVVAEGSTRIKGGFWARRFLPSLLIVMATIALLLLVYWLASTGVVA